MVVIHKLNPQHSLQDDEDFIKGNHFPFRLSVRFPQRKSVVEVNSELWKVNRLRDLINITEIGGFQDIENQSSINKFIEKWRTIGLDTKPTNYRKANKALCDLYEVYSYEKPREIRYYDSPIKALIGLRSYFFTLSHKAAFKCYKVFSILDNFLKDSNLYSFPNLVTKERINKSKVIFTENEDLLFKALRDTNLDTEFLEALEFINKELENREAKAITSIYLINDYLNSALEFYINEQDYILDYIVPYLNQEYSIKVEKTIDQEFISVDCVNQFLKGKNISTILSLSKESNKTLLDSFTLDWIHVNRNLDLLDIECKCFIEENNHLNFGSSSNLSGCWLGYYEYIFQYLKLNDFKLYKIIKALANLAEEVQWYWNYEEIVFASSKLKKLSLDEQGQLHSIGAPALIYPNGDLVSYFYHGVELDKQFLEDPFTISIEKIRRNSNNIERVALIELYDLVNGGEVYSGAYVRNNNFIELDRDTFTSYDKGKSYKENYYSKNKPYQRVLLQDLITKDRFLICKDSTNDRLYYLIITSPVTTCKAAHESLSPIKEEDIISVS